MACGIYEAPLSTRKKKVKNISLNMMALLSRSR